MRRPLLLPLLLLACTERPLGDTDSGSSGTASSTSPGSASSGVPTTGAPTTSGTTSPPITTGPVDPTGDGTLVTTAIPPPDVPSDMPPQTGLVGCHLDAPPGTAVEGDTDAGAFVAHRAYFGVIAAFDDPWAPILLFASPEADPAVEVVNPNGVTGPVLHGDVSTDLLEQGGWLGTWTFFGTVYVPGQAHFPPGLTVTIEALAGNWDVPDPNDPPRLVGTLAGPIAGPFDAIYCDKLDAVVIVE